MFFLALPVVSRAKASSKARRLTMPVSPSVSARDFSCSADSLSAIKYGKMHVTRDQTVTQQTQAQALRRAFSLAQQRYESGVASYLEVLDAQRQLFDAELALVQVQRQYLAAAVQLYKALGGTWSGSGGGSG